MNSESRTGQPGSVDLLEMNSGSTNSSSVRSGPFFLKRSMDLLTVGSFFKDQDVISVNDDY